jgi:hypothetical protein
MKIGNFVKPKPNSKFQLRSGSSFYSYAIVVSLQPFILVSHSGDMRWESTITVDDFEVDGEASSDELRICMKRLE